MKPADLAALLLLSLVWGSAFLFIEVVVDELPPLTVVAGRLSIAAIVVGLALRLTGRGFVPRAMIPALLVVTVTNNILPLTLITWAQQYITSSLAATLVATMPLFTFVIAAAVGSERATFDRAAGVLIGFAGAAVLIGPDLSDLTSSSAAGDLAVIGGSIGYAVSTVVAREKLHGDPMALAGGQMLFGAAATIPLALAVDGVPDLGLSPEAALAWTALGVLSSGLAYIVFFGLIQRVSATNAALVSYLIPIVATLLGWAVLDEPLGPNLFVGIVLIVLGMMAVNGTLRGLFTRRTPGAERVAEIAPAGHDDAP